MRDLKTEPEPGRRAGVPRLEHLPLVAAVTYIGAYVAVALLRLSYPFELEFVEGAILTGVERLAAGRRLYEAPSLDYVALNYPPLYFWLGALATKLLGPGFLPLRLVSFLCSLGGLGLVYALVRRETGARSAGLLAAGMFAACFTLVGAWYDLARADSLWLMLLLAGIAALRWDSSRWRAPVVAGTLFSLAFLAKQSTAVVIAPIALHALLTDRGRFLALAGTLAVLLGGSHLLLDMASGGWYSFYVYRVALAHSITPSAATAFWTGDMLGPVAIALLAALFFLVVRRPGGPDVPRGFFGAAAAGLVLCAWWLRVYPGGYTNVLMPAYAALAVLAGLGWHELRGAISLSRPPLRTRLTVFAVTALLAQFAILAYNPARFLPGRADHEAGELFLRRLQAIEGEVIVPRHGYLLARVGRPPGFQEMPFMDVVKGSRRDVADRLLGQLRAALRAHRYGAVILDNRDWLDEEVERFYLQRRAAFDDDLAFWPKTGLRTRPSRVMMPRTP